MFDGVVNTPMFDIPETLQRDVLRTLSNLDEGTFAEKVKCYFLKTFHQKCLIWLKIDIYYRL